MSKVLLIWIGVLGVLIPVLPSAQGRGSWERGHRKNWSDPIPLGPLGFMCSSRQDMTNCLHAMSKLKQLYGIAFNKARCSRTVHNNAKWRRQCHVKYKRSKHTDFECYVTNTPDMSGAAIAKCRAPWGKNLAENQSASAGALMAQGVQPGGQMGGMSRGMSGGMMGNPMMRPPMGMPPMGMGQPMGMGPSMGMGMSPPMGMPFGG